MSASIDVLLLHPGKMGFAVGRSLLNAGARVSWCSAGRSEATRKRAAELGLHEWPDLHAACENCQVIFSVCPPHGAEAQAEAVKETGFQGLYLEANAIQPDRSRRIARSLGEAGIPCVDGGIVGGPPTERGQTWLYLSGPNASEVLPLFSEGPLETEVVGDAVGRASALKMCYASWTKGSTALLCTVLAAAESLGVREELSRQWDREGGGLREKAELRASRVTAKAWRFAGEMEEIAETFLSAGLPGDFHKGAAELYRRMAHFKDHDGFPDVDDVLKALKNSRGDAETRRG